MHMGNAKYDEKLWKRVKENEWGGKVGNSMKMHERGEKRLKYDKIGLRG